MGSIATLGRLRQSDVSGFLYVGADMSKRDDIEGARIIQEMHLYYMEMTASNPARVLAKQHGYRYLRITITDVETGEVMGSAYTMRRHSEGPTLLRSLAKAAAWPRNLLDKLHVIALAGGRELTRGPQSARLIADRQKLGGRQKQSDISEDVKKRYLSLAKWYYEVSESEPDITEREFCRRANIPRSRLTRALKHASRNRP
jgi:hypothetical protein